MRAFIVESLIGILGFDESLKLVQKSVFQQDPETIGKNISILQQGEITDDVERVVKGLMEKGFDEFVSEDEQLANSIAKKYDIRVRVETPSAAGKSVRSRMASLSKEVNFVASSQELYSLLHEVNLSLTRQRIRGAAERRDKLIVQAIEATDDIDKTLNLFASRMREWYGLYFPELDKLVEDHETFAKLVSKIGDREEFTKDGLQGLAKFSDALSTEIERQAKKSMGARIAEYDLSRIRDFASIIVESYKLRSEIEEYINEVMKEVAPNVTSLAGPMIGARLMSLAGGIMELSRLPASTVQVLGAEKALFRALRTGARPPKHGIIFQHPFLHRASWWQRGKVARVLAGKLSIAAKIDAYSGEYQADELKYYLEKRIEEIKKKYPKPTVRKEPDKPRREWPKKEFRREGRDWRRR